jgi:hypothetical protein
MTLPFMKVRGMAIFPFIFLRRREFKQDAVLVNHEKIHIRQQLELFILPFFMLYFINYLYNLIQCRNHTAAYRNIIFEKEAYDHDHEPGYLSRRKHFASFSYF